jgi:hypothetical protein
LAIIVSPPDIKVGIIKNYLNFLENRLDTLNYRAILLGDFSAPGFDWNCCLLPQNCHFSTKLKGDLIYSAICFLGLNQNNYPDNGSNLPDLVFFQILLIFRLIMLNTA